MASGGTLPLVTGAFTATGAAISIETVGFRPKKVTLYNLDDPAMGIHTDTMDDDSLLAITDTCAAVSSGGVTLTDEGFDLGTDGNFNTAGEQIHYVAQG